MAEKDSFSDRLACIDTLIPHSLKGYCLDAACGGFAIAAKVYAKGYDYVGVDQEIPAKNGKPLKGHPFVRGDVIHLPYATRQFELVIATEIIEHFENGEPLLLELKRVLKDEGHLIIATPNKLSWEGVKGKIAEIIRRTQWTAWGAWIISMFIHRLNF